MNTLRGSLEVTLESRADVGKDFDCIWTGTNSVTEVSSRTSTDTNWSAHKSEKDSFLAGPYPYE